MPESLEEWEELLFDNNSSLGSLEDEYLRVFISLTLLLLS